MDTSRLLARVVHFLCFKLMDTSHDRGATPRSEPEQMPDIHSPRGSNASSSSGRRGRAKPPPERDSAWESEVFVKIYEGYADVYERLRRKRSSTLFHLPVMLLCIRSACETLFRDVYPAFSKCEAGLVVLRDMDAAITAMFDPDSWHSRISIFESSVDALKVMRDPNLKSSEQSSASKVYGTSPVIRSLFAGDVSSTFAKRQVSAAKGQQEAVAAPLPLAVRQRLYRKALIRVQERAGKRGVKLTHNGPPHTSTSKGPATDHGHPLPFGADPDDDWLFTKPEEAGDSNA